MMFVNNDQAKLNNALTFLRKYSIVNYETNSTIAYNQQLIRIHSLAQLFLQSIQTDQEIVRNLIKISSVFIEDLDCLLYTSPSPRDKRQSRMPSSA